MLVAIGGLSGSGKSTLARSLASSIGPAPGAVVLRSDEVRKSLCGVPPLTALGADGYRREITEQVYATLAELGAQIARTGHGVVIDAVYAEAAARDTIEAAARRAGMAFAGLWLDAPEPVLVARVQARTGDASDADAGVCASAAGETDGWHQLAPHGRGRRSRSRPGGCEVAPGGRLAAPVAQRGASVVRRPVTSRIKIR